jgi:hypothetical protein
MLHYKREIALFKEIEFYVHVQIVFDAALYSLIQ